MAPLQSSPLSHSAASEEETSAAAHTEEVVGDGAEEGGSDDSLTTPKPGPTDPALRTQAHLSTPAVPVTTAEDNSRSSSSSRGFDTKIFHHPPTLRIQQEQKPRSVSFGASPKRPGDVQPGAAAEGKGIDVPRPTSSLSRVSFSSGTSLPKPEKQGSYHYFGGRGSRHQDGDGNMGLDGNGDGEASSSADESTAIMKKQRHAANYGALEEDDEQQQQGQQDDMGNANGSHEPVAGNEPPATVKKRKSHVGRGRNSLRGQDQHHQQQEGDDEEHDTWWTRFLEKYGSVELENKGSVARDHLALERTFLAWLRTSLSFASIGIAITQLFRLNTSLSNVKDPSKQESASSSSSFLDTSSSPEFLRQQKDKRDLTFADTHRLRHVGKPLGATFLAIAILILLLGFHRYFESQHYVIRGKFPASRGTILIVSFVATGLICASLAVVLTVAPSTFES